MFTMELEESGYIPLLDVKLQRSDTKLEFFLYRKPTHTDRYPHYSSNHHTLVHRAWNPCGEDNLLSEINYVEQTLNNNGYFVQQVVKRQSGQLNQNRVVVDQFKEVTFMPYVKGVSDMIRRFFTRGGVKAYHTRSTKLRDYRSHPKDSLSKDHTPCVDSLSCSCGEQYIGQTKRPLQVRVTEHKRDSDKGKVTGSALAEHACNEGHVPLRHESKSMVQVPHLGMRLIREALEIRGNETSTYYH